MIKVILLLLFLAGCGAQRITDLGGPRGLPPAYKLEGEYGWVVRKAQHLCPIGHDIIASREHQAEDGWWLLKIKCRLQK